MAEVRDFKLDVWLGLSVRVCFGVLVILCTQLYDSNEHHELESDETSVPDETESESGPPEREFECHVDNADDLCEYTYINNPSTSTQQTKRQRRQPFNRDNQLLCTLPGQEKKKDILEHGVNEHDDHDAVFNVEDSFPPPTEQPASESVDCAEFDIEVEDFDLSDAQSEISDCYNNTNDESETEILIHSNDQTEDLQPLYPGANITTGAIMLLLALFITKYNLVGDAIQQLLEILGLVLPSGHNLCSSVGSFRNFFQNLRNPLVKHHYCGYCLGAIKDTTVKVCPYSKCKKSLSKNMHYFLEMPIKSQLKQLFLQKEFYSNLQGRFSHPKNGYYDIYNGKLYKSYFDFDGPLSNPDNISFTFNTDGASVFKSSNVSVWPLFLVINELPYHLRMKKENMLLAGLWFGNKKPNMETYLQPFLETFNELENGIDIASPDRENSFKLKAFLLCGTADLPARSILCNSVQFNGSYSCWKCLQKGETAKVGKGHCHVFPYKEDQPKGPIRSKQNVMQDTQKSIDLIDAGKKEFTVNGIKGPSWLTFFPRFDIVSGIAIDYMHGTLLGVQKLLLTLWFGAVHKNKIFSFYQQLGKVDERIQNIKPTLAITRLPRSISRELKYWKASEFRSFLLYYGAPVMNGILDNERFVHYLFFVNAIFILLKSGSTESDIMKAEYMLFEFVRLFSKLYDKCFMTLNMHQLLHMADSVRHLGPLYTHSCFSFEDKNGILLKMIQGTQNIDNQIMTGVSFLQKLPELKQTTISHGSCVEDLCNSIENSNILKRGLKLEKDVYVLGSVKSKILTNAEHRAVCQCLGYDPALLQYQYFNRIEYHNNVIYGTCYGRMVKRDNSTVCFKSGSIECFGKVSCFLLIDNKKILAIIKELACTNYQEQLNILSVEKLNDTFKAIRLETIIESCIHVVTCDASETSFVCRIPNRLESD